MGNALDALIATAPPKPSTTVSPKGNALDELLAAHPKSATPSETIPQEVTGMHAAEERFQGNALSALMHGTADLLETMDQPATWLFGPYKMDDKWAVAEHGYGPVASKWLEEHAPSVAPSKDTGELISDTLSGVTGAAIPGVAEYAGKVPFAILHGIHTAQEQAKAQGRSPTFYETTKDIITEAFGRWLMGKIGSQQMGRLTRGLAFGAVSGGEDIGEHRDTKQSAIDAAVNGVIGAIAPEITPGEKAKIEEAKAAAARGDGKGAMHHLDPVLKAHEDTIAEAARTAAQAIRPDFEKLGDDMKVSREARERAQRRWDKKAAEKANAGLPAVRTPGTEVAEPGGEALQEETRAPLEPRAVKRDVDASLAVRIAQKAHYVAVMKNRMTGWENLFRGMPTDERMKLLSDYQSGGIDKVPQEWKSFFEDFEQLHNEMASSEHAAGIEYEMRDNYVTGMWRDPAKAESVFGPQRYRAGIGKPGFTKEKVFDTYLEGIKAGLEPLTTNPAVIATYRMEASAMAMTRVLAMRDMVSDGYAIPVEDLSEPVKRGPAGFRPSDWAGGVERDVGGKRYLVHPEAARLLDWALQMDRHTLAGMLGISPNGTTMNVAMGAGKAWMIARNATIPIKLTLSAFHALHILGIEAFQPIAAALTQGFNRRISFGDVVKSIRDSDTHGKFEYGRKLSDLHKKPPEELMPDERLELNIMTLGGLNPTMPSVYEVRAEENWRRLWNDEVPRVQEEIKKEGLGRLGSALRMTPAMADAALLTIGRASEAFQGPMFREWIPSLKAAAYMNEAKLTIASRPELLEGTPQSNAQLRQAMRTIAKSIDNRFGEMQYDKVFMPRLIRMGLMGSLLSVGWNYGFVREFGGALADAGWMGKMPAPLFIDPAIQGEVSSRMVYFGVYTMGALMLGGLMSYILSGKVPFWDDASNGFNDLVYPLMPDGSRLNTMFFTREFGAIYHHIADEGLVGGAKALFENKLAPLFSSFLEVLYNEDYYGRQIRDPNASMVTQLGQGMGHMVTSNLSPISIQPLTQGVEETPGSMALSFGGFAPAPKYVTRPAINTAILRSYANAFPDRPIPFAEVERSDDVRTLKMQYKQWLKTQTDADQEKFNTSLAAYVNKYPDRVGRGGSNLTRMLRAWQMPDNAQQFKELDRATQEKILREASPDERAIYLPYAHTDVRAKFQH